MSDAPLPGNPWAPFDPAKLDPSHAPLALRTLRYMAAFTRLQDNAGWFLRGWIDARPDEAAAVDVAVADLRRLRDSSIKDFVRIAARSVVPHTDMTNFAGTFARVKDVRDHIAHAMFLNLTLEVGVPSFGVPYYHDESRVARLENRRSSLDDALLTKRERELLWLLEVVEWLAQEAGYRMGPGTLNRVVQTPPRAAPRR